MRWTATFLTLLSFSGLVAYGLVFVYSSTLPEVNLNEGSSDGGFTLSRDLKKQAIFYAIGSAIILVCATVSPRRWKAFIPFGYWANFALLILVLFVGVVRGGAQSWIDLKFFSYQPSETMKVLWILWLAHHLRYQKKLREIQGLIAPLIMTALPVLLIVKQPDLGTAIIFFPTLFMVLFLAGAKLKHLGGLLLILGVLAIPAWANLKPYQKNRLRAFLDPAKYEKNSAYQLTQSLNSIREGGLFGKGIGHGLVSRFDMLPERHNDFIFSVIAAELGLLGATGLLLCYAIMIFSFLVVAFYTREPFGKIAAYSLAVLLANQTFINLGVAIGLLPTTGITLPFVSAGGSSIMTSCLLVGIVLSICRHPTTLLASEDFH